MQTKDISDLLVIEAYLWSERQLENNTDYEECRPYTYIINKTGCSFKVAWRAMQRASNKGLIDYGVNLRGGWVTNKGKELTDVL